MLARHIVEFRTQRGGFTSVAQLREVNGIGPSRFADLKTLVTL
ncbi:ComEA family DNA-binding protein [Streptomyces smaragdinus]